MLGVTPNFDAGTGAFAAMPLKACLSRALGGQRHPEHQPNCGDQTRQITHYHNTKLPLCAYSADLNPCANEIVLTDNCISTHG
ncbi:MAG: hypothetical protein AAGF32_10295, partial [Pseudomonadota bacterium]